MVFENRVLRRIFGPKTEKITGEWRKLQNCPGDQIWENKMAEHVARMEERVCECRVMVGKPEGKRLLGRLRPRWEDNIKMDLQEVECGVWTGSGWLTL